MASCSTCEGLMATAERALKQDKRKVVGVLALAGMAGLLIYAATREG